MNDIEIVVRGKPKTGKSGFAYLLAARLDELFPGQVHMDDPESAVLGISAAFHQMQLSKFFKRVRESGQKITIKMETK